MHATISSFNDEGNQKVVEYLREQLAADRYDDVQICSKCMIDKNISISISSFRMYI